MKVTILNQQAAVDKTEKEIRQYKDALGDVTKAELKAAASGKDVSDVLDGAGGKAKKSSGGFTVLKGALANLVADGFRAAVQGAKDLVTAAIDYESAFTDVKKTVDGTDEQLANLDQEIRNMAKSMPQSASDIAEVAAAAGQLGIETDSIAGFTKTMIQLGDSTNLSSEEAASALAKFANITNMSADDYSKLGSVIVDLGNNFATTENDIVNMGTNLAAAGSQVGMSESNIMALGAALSSVGMEADAGGTAFSKLLLNMQVAAETGSEELSSFASVANMSAGEFKKAFKEDAVGALQSFIGGLADSESKGQSAVAILDEMGITEVRLRDSILRATGAKDTFNKAIETSNKAWSADVALQNEANKRYETTASKLKILKNNITDVGLQVFDALLPALQQGADALMAWVQSVDWEAFSQKFSDALNKAIDVFKWFIDNKGAVIGGIAAIGGAFGALSLVEFVSRIQKAIELVKAWSLATKLQTAAQWALNSAFLTSPITLTIAAIAALVAAFVLLWKKSDGFRNFWIGLWEGIKNACSTAKEWIGQQIDAIGKFFTETIPQALNSVVEYFKQLPTNISTWLTGVITKVSEWSTNIAQKAKEAGVNFVESIVTFFQELPYKIGYVLGFVIGKVISWGKDLYNFATTAIPKFINTIIDFMRELPGKVWTWLVNTINKVNTWATNMISKAKDAAANFVERAIDYIRQLPEKIWTWLVNTINRVLEWRANMVEKARDAATNFINTVVDYIQQLPGRVWTWLVNTISRMSQWVSDMGSKGREAISNLISKVIEGAASIPEKMAEVGKNIVDGVWNGIKNAKDRFLGNVKEFFSGTVDGAKKALKINSPSKVFAKEVGSAIPEGIALGISKNAKSALTAIKELTAGTLGSAKIGLKTGATGGAGTVGGGVVNNFTQVINAPKQLSRLEIYRQSKNLLGYAGGGL